MAKSQSKSLLRTPLQSVVVFRDKKQVVPPIGQPFEFTAEEIEQIEAANPSAISDQVTMAADALQTMQEQATENKSGETL
jgi:hypothetical protein